MSRKVQEHDALDDALDDSFPASDPPAMTASTTADPLPAPSGLGEGVQEVLDACNACAIACMQCLTEMASRESHNQCPTSCVECAAICRLTADALARDSPNADQFRVLCAQVCDWCAAECEAHDHEHCRACAQACKACAAACL